MNENLRMTLIYTLLIVFGLTMIVPFIWMISTALMTQAEFNKHEAVFIPKEEYYVWDQAGDESGEQRILLVTTKADSSIIHILDEQGRITEEYKPVPSSEIRKVKKLLSFHFDNFIKAFKKVPFALYFGNTIYVSFMSLIGVLITSLLAAYAFGRMEFKGRDFFFYLFFGNLRFFL